MKGKPERYIIQQTAVDSTPPFPEYRVRQGVDTVRGGVLLIILHDCEEMRAFLPPFRFSLLFCQTVSKTSTQNYFTTIKLHLFGHVLSFSMLTKRPFLITINYSARVLHVCRKTG